VLGVEPGSVTPLALVNDEARVVRLALDRGLKEGGPVNAHPLVNTMTTAVAIQDLLRLFEATGHAPLWLDFPV
jgi:Ala-tRNA(Pro) deacylase